jgi:hypothetical protein
VVVLMKTLTTRPSGNSAALVVDAVVAMTESEVVALMESSQNEAEWDANCDHVQAACDGYPAFWFAAVMLSGLAARVAARW